MSKTSFPKFFIFAVLFPVSILFTPSILSPDAFAHNKVVVVPMGDTCDAPSCGPDLNDPCIEGVGICQRAGIMICNDTLTGTECSATPGSPMAEICNGLDDNCNGDTDESFPNLGEICVVGIGACQVVGNFICDVSNPAGSTVCSATPSPPSAAEVCNGIDDDCDGDIDEEISIPQPCPLQVGVCAGAISSACEAGNWLSCSVADYGPNYEADETTCDDLDNDCDGQVDESFDLSADTTNCGQCGNVCDSYPHADSVCQSGICGWSCQSGYLDCDSSPGCETSANTTENCGACGQSCSAGQICTDGQCVSS